MIMVTNDGSGGMATERTIKAGEFKAKCLDLMDQVAAKGDVIVITKRGKPVARLVPVRDRPATLRGFLKGHVAATGDIVSPIDATWDAAKP
jgi:prevent-host-death family protein